MRSAILILLTIAVLGGGFALYTWLQPPAAMITGRTISDTARAGPRHPASQSFRGVGRGEAPWMKQFDDGELASQFKGEEMIPQADGTVAVTRPVAEFFTKDSMIRVEGASGVVVVPAAAEETPGKIQQDASLQPPTRGTLQDVVISLFEPADATEPTLVARVNNAAFDNDHFRIATEGYTDEKGVRVEADQVPVTVRGRDYDFDGRGLIVSWNVRDRKLQRLQIEHGESLTVKNPSSLGDLKLDPAAPATSPAARMSDPAVRTSAAGGPMLASSDPRSFVLVAAAAEGPAAPAGGSRSSAAARRKRAVTPPPSNELPPTTRTKVQRDTSPVVYRATFEQDVQIFEAEKRIVAADALSIDLMQSPKRDPSTLPAAEGDDDPTPATTRRSASKDRDTPGTRPASQPSIGPITVKWTGKLRIVPLDETPDPKLVPDKAIVRITGAPVILSRDGTEARAGAAVYNSADSSASLRSSDAVPQVTMTDARGAKVTTPQLDYNELAGGQRFATLIGASRAEFPVEGDGGKIEQVVATWADQCRLHLAGGGASATAPGGAAAGAGDLTIQSAELRGKVDVRHPQLAMTAGELTLAFDPARAAQKNPPNEASALAVAPSAAVTTEPARSPSTNVSAALRSITAKADVHCEISDVKGRQTIDTQSLRVETDKGPDGALYARQLNADGGVRTVDADGRELRAASLTAELAPATRPAATAVGSPVAEPATAPDAKPGAQGPAPTSKPSNNPFGAGGSVRLVSLAASGDVVLSSPDGTRATADALKAIGRPDGSQEYRLVGRPLATVGDGKTMVTGPSIRFAPAEKIAEIEGPGGMHGEQPDKPGETVDISWVGGAVVNGGDDTIRVRDKVEVKSKQADGTVNATTSDGLLARLGPKQAKPATAPPPGPTSSSSQPPPPTSAVAIAPASRPAKSVESDFLADKDINSATLSGNVQVRSELLSPTDGSIVRAMNLFAEKVNYDRVSGRFDVPVAGKMLYRDHRPRDAKKPDAEGPTLGSGRGNTAFEWKKSLEYDPAASRATMSGGVRVTHWAEPEPKAKDPAPAGAAAGNAVPVGEKFNLSGDTLVAELAPAAPAGGAGAAAADPFGPGAKMDLRRVVVRDNVVVESARLNLKAKELIFDPVKQVLTARGDDASPITVFDNEKGTSQTATELEWNTRTDEFRIVGLRGRI